jgi:hypothetical protein
MKVGEPGSAVGIANGYEFGGSRGWSSSPGRPQILLFRRRPDRFWGPRSLLSTGYGG